MRSLLALVVAALLAPSAASVDGPAPLAVTVVAVGDEGAIVTWTPAPGVTTYTILRGPTPESAQIIGRSTTTAFFDPSAPEVETWYIVIGSTTLLPDFADMEYRGACVKQKGATGMSIAVSNCVPIFS